MGKNDEVSLAGAVLSKGNPFAEGESARDLIANMFPPEHRDFLMTRLSAFLSPYFEAALSLAGDVLSSGHSLTGEQKAAVLEAASLLRSYEAHHAAKPDPEKAERNAHMAAKLERAFNLPKLAPASLETPVAAETEGPDMSLAEMASADRELTPSAHMLALLKGQHPMGVSWAKLANAIDYDVGRPLRDETAPWTELREAGLVREDDDGNVFAAEKVVADPTVPALSWPITR